MKEIYEVLMPVVEHPALDPARTAVVIIDMQKLDAHRDYGFGKKLREHGRDHLAHEYFDRVESTVVPNQVTMTDAARRANIPVIFVRIAAHNGSTNANLQYRLWNIVPRFSDPESEILAELGPHAGDTVVEKISTSAFNGSTLEQNLRNLNIERLVVGGVNTNNCVEMTARDATDRGYWVDVVEDCCAALAGPAAHADSIKRMNFGVSRVVSTEQAVQEFDRSQTE